MYRQSAVIPYRFNGQGKLRLLLITSRKRKRWIIPKGVIEPDLSSRKSAAKEALEEAGILGSVSDDMLGTYEYAKWGGVCHVEVFGMRVERILEEWMRWIGSAGGVLPGMRLRMLRRGI